MALPFLNNKKDTGIAGTIIKQRSPNGDEAQPDESQNEYSAEDCAHDLMDAISKGDAAGVAKAVKDLIAASEPQEETPEPHSYDAQNQAAEEG